MKITRKQVRELMRETLINQGVIINEQAESLPEPEQGVDVPISLDFDREELVGYIADTLWKDSIYAEVENGKIEGWIPDDVSHESVIEQFGNDRPQEVDREASDFLNALEGYAGKGIKSIIVDLNTDDIEALGYYIPMQMMGYEVNWSDDQEGELDTPEKESIEARMAAQDLIRQNFGQSSEDEEDIDQEETDEEGTDEEGADEEDTDLEDTEEESTDEEGADEEGADEEDADLEDTDDEFFSADDFNLDDIESEDTDEEFFSADDFNLDDIDLDDDDKETPEKWDLNR